MSNIDYCAYCGGKAGPESAELAVGGNDPEIVCRDCQDEPPEYFKDTEN